MTDEVKKLEAMFKRFSSAAKKTRNYRKDNELYYYSDVDDTLSQYDKKQKDEIKVTFDIPISTKITYPIIENFIAFLTGAKPFPRLIAADDSVKQFTLAYEKAYHGVWTESKSDDELTKVLRDMFVVGSGFMYVRKNDFFNETTFNTIHRHIPWENVYIDNESKQKDFSDAEGIVLAERLRVGKAEKIYDVTIDKKDIEGDPWTEMSAWEEKDLGFQYFEENDYQKNRYVWVKQFFVKEEINVYIGDDVYIGTKKPVSIEIPNKEKIALGEEIQGMIDLQDKGMNAYEKTDEFGNTVENQETYSDESMGKSLEGSALAEAEKTEITGRLEKTQDETFALQKQMAMMPDMVPGYEMETETGQKVIVKEIGRILKKRIKRTLVIGTKKYESEYLPTDKYPLAHFCISHNKSPNKTYGMLHYIKDFQEGMNKLISLILEDAMTHSHRKVFAFKDSIVESEHAESRYSQPGAFIYIEPDNNLIDNGMPKIIEPSPINNALVQLLEKMHQMVEYVSGIFGVMQGNSGEAVRTFGATQSLQNFGTQRIKLYSRSIEPPLEDLAYLTVAYLQKYMPRDKYITYFNGDGNVDFVQLLDNTEDLQFKVRVNITKSLPTIREMTAELLAMISGQTKDPNVANYLTKYVLKILDLPEGDELAEQIDVIKMLEQQIQQLQMQLEQSNNMNKSLTNNLQQAQIGAGIDLAKAKAQGEINLAKEQAVAGAESPAMEMPAAPQSADSDDIFI